MFDNLSTQHDPLSWHKTVSYGDIVQFRFPMEDRDDQEHATLRPCLVLDVETLAGIIYLVLAPGVAPKAGCGSDRSFHISIHDPDILAAAGLKSPVCFDAGRRIFIPLTHAGFEPTGSFDTPVSGCLTGRAFNRMNNLRARIHAERDIAREYRAERRRSRRDNPKKHRGRVVIERRRPKRPIRPVIGDVA